MVWTVLDCLSELDAVTPAWVVVGVYASSPALGLGLVVYLCFGDGPFQVLLCYLCG